MLQPPEHVLGVIAPDAEIERVAFGIILRPNVLAVSFPTLRDGVADENDPGLARRILDALIQIEKTIGRGVGAWRWNDAAIDLRHLIGLTLSGAGDERNRDGRNQRGPRKKFHAERICIACACGKRN